MIEKIKEMWRDIPGFEGKYQISSLGRIKSLETRKGSGFHKNGSYSLKREKILKPTDNGTGYLKITLSLYSKRKSYFVHRLVAQAFISNPNHYDIVNHKDKNKRNNCASNLEWCTAKYNVNYSIDYARRHRPRYKKQINNSSGEHHISKRKKGNQIYYRVHWKEGKKDKEKMFKTLDEAILFRDCLYENLEKRFDSM